MACAVSADPPPSDEATAYRLAAGSVAHDRVIALGQDLEIEGVAKNHAVALSGNLILSGEVEGDVIVLGGDARLAPSALVAGDVFVLGGHVQAEDGATIAGRSVAYPNASDLWVTLIQGPTLGLPPTSPVVIGAKLALLAFWSFLVIFLMSFSHREMSRTSESVRKEPFRNFMVGMTGVAAMVLTALFFSAFSGALLGLPLLVLLMVVALVLRFWGMVAVFHALGQWVFQRFDTRPPLPLTAATYGLVTLGILKFFPYLGLWTWTVATFIGVGAALTTRLGREDTWLEPI